VTVNSIPAAPTVTTPVNFCQNTTATALTATGTSLLWYTLPGATGSGSATAPTPSTTTAGASGYYVSQTINGCESPRAAITINVNATPAAPIVTTPINYCQGAVATALAATGSSLLWYTALGGGIGNTQAPIPSTSAIGAVNYYVSQTVNNCESPQASIVVAINSLPTATITSTSSTTFCSGDNVILNANAGTGLTYQWNNDGTIINGATEASYTATTTGSYTLTVTNAYNCTVTSATTIINVDTMPSVSNAGSVQYITTTTASLAANVPTIGTGAWSVISGTGTFGNSASATTTVSGLSTGTNVLQWTISSGICPASSSTVIINVGLSPVAQTISGKTNVTENETGVTYSVPDSGGSTYHWTLPPGATITAANADSSSITASFGITGGNVAVTQTNAYGSATSSLPVSVGNGPVPQTISGPIYVPTGETGVTYSIPDSSYNYHWTLPGGAIITSANSDSSSVTVSFGATGGTVGVTQTNSFGSATSILSVSVGNAPVIQTIVGLDSIAVDQTGVVYSVHDNNGSTYHWSLPPGATITSASADSSQITVSFGATVGTVSVTETNPYGTAISYLTLSVNSNTSTTAVISGTSASFYEVRPNPFSDYTTIIVHCQATEQVTLTVINVQGITCYSSSQYYTNQEFTLGNELSTDGVYFVQLAFGNETKVIKLVKIK